MRSLRTRIHQECQPPWAPFLPESVELMEILPPADFLPLGWASFPLSKWGLLAKDGPLDPGKGLFCTMKWNPVCGPGLTTPPRRKRLRQAHGRLLLSLCQRPVNTAIQAGLTRKNHISETVKKRELWSPHFTMLSGNRIKHMLKYELSFQLIWKQSCPKMLWPWSKSQTSNTGITPPSESGREERVSRRATLRWEMSCSVSRVAWAAAPTPVCKSHRDLSAFLLAEAKVMLSGGVEDLNPKAAGWLEK